MRVTLATFIILLSVILAIIFVKYRPMTTYYISLEQYYAVTQFCTSWGYKDFTRCLEYTLSNDFKYISSISIAKYSRNNTNLQSILNNDTLRSGCRYMYILAKYLYSKLGNLKASYVCYNGTINISIGKVGPISYNAFMLVVCVEKELYYVASDYQNTIINVTPQQCQWYKVLMYPQINITLIVVNCSGIKNVSSLYIEDERGLSVRISSS